MKSISPNKEARAWLKDWEKRKGYYSDFAGPHTTPEEDKAARIIFCYLYKEKTT